MVGSILWQKPHGLANGCLCCVRMIVRKRLKWSLILRRAWKSVTFASALALMAMTLHHAGVALLEVPPLATAALGTALAIFLAFHNNTSYERWWEARKQWGSLVNASRNLARQVLTLLPQDDSQASALTQAMVLRQVAWAHALRLHLRRQPQFIAELKPLLAADEFEYVRTANNVPLALMQRQGEQMAQAKRLGFISDYQHVYLDQTLSELIHIQGACERIKGTPLPRQYEYFTKLFVYFYTALLPFAFVEGLGWRTAFFSVPIGFLFFALEGVAEVNEDPFENAVSDTPMTALCRTIEINLRSLLGEKNLPSPLEPVDGFLF
jgi:ion channel-forming bestrophin family protein